MAPPELAFLCERSLAAGDAAVEGGGSAIATTSARVKALPGPKHHGLPEAPNTGASFGQVAALSMFRRWGLIT